MNYQVLSAEDSRERGWTDAEFDPGTFLLWDVWMGTHTLAMAGEEAELRWFVRKVNDAFQEGYEQGYEDAIDTGYDAGYDDGLETARSEATEKETV